uniref:Uncharacterized protein n=1 Tax=Arundo donax TaxID=35708 RepID=A0A0A8ZKR8_ARUDO
MATLLLSSMKFQFLVLKVLKRGIF